MGDNILGVLDPFYVALTTPRPFVTIMKDVDASATGTGLSEVAGARRGMSYLVSVAGSDLGIALEVGDWLVCKAAFDGTPADLSDFEIYRSNGGGGGGDASPPNNSIQYNSAGDFAGSANLVFDGNTLTFKGDTDWNKPTRTVFVRTEDDFSATTAIINGDEYFVLDQPTTFVVLNDISLTKGITFSGDKDFLFTSQSGGARGDYTPKITWNGFTTLANPVFLSTGALDNFAVQSLNFIDGAGGSNYLFDIGISSSNLVQWRDCQIAGFDNIFNLACRFQIVNCRLTGALNELTCVMRDKCYFHNNNLLGISTANNIVINAGSTNALMTFSKNFIQNTSSNAFSIDSAIDSENQIHTFDNKATFPKQFFDMTAGKIGLTDPRITSTSNMSVNDSSIVSKVIYVTQESDFGPLVQKTVPTVGMADFHLLEDDTKYILLNDVILTATLTIGVAINVTITSGNDISAKLIANPPLAGVPLFFWDNSAIASVNIDNVRVESVQAGTPRVVFGAITAVGGYDLICKNVVFDSSFTTYGTVQKASKLVFIECDLDRIDNAFTIDSCGFVHFYNNFTDNQNTNQLVFTTTIESTPIALILTGSRSQNGNAAGQNFIRIDPSLPANSTFLIVNNDSNFPQNFFDTSAGGIDQTDIRVKAYANRGVPDSAIVTSTVNGAQIRSDLAATVYHDGTGNYSVPGGDHVAVDILFIKQESDLPATVTVNLGPPFGTADYHSVSVDTEIILLNDVTLVNGIVATGGATVSISSGNKDSARLISNLSITTGPLLLSSTPDTFTVDGLIVESITAGTANLLIYGSPGNVKYTLKDSSFTGFANIGQITSTGTASVDIINCKGSFSTGGLLFITPQNIRMLYSELTYGGTGDILEFSGVSQPIIQIDENKVFHSSGFFLNIGNSFTNFSTIQVNNNMSDTPDNLFNPAGLNQNALIVRAFDNYNALNTWPGEVLVSASVIDQAPAVAGVAEIVMFDVANQNTDYINYTAINGTFSFSRGGKYQALFFFNVNRSTGSGNRTLAIQDEIDTGGGFVANGEPILRTLGSPDEGGVEVVALPPTVFNTGDVIRVSQTATGGGGDIGLYFDNTTGYNNLSSARVKWCKVE